jgi:hypothetical protein
MRRLRQHADRSIRYVVAASKGVETSTAQTDADLVKLTRRFMMFSPAPGPYGCRAIV